MRKVRKRKCRVCEEMEDPGHGWVDGRVFICEKCCEDGNAICAACGKAFPPEDIVADEQNVFLCRPCFNRPPKED